MELSRPKSKSVLTAITLPQKFPLALSMDNNSTVLTFAGLSNIDRSSIAIQTQPTPYAVQVRRAELVKFQALVNGERVEEQVFW